VLAGLPVTNPNQACSICSSGQTWTLPLGFSLPIASGHPASCLPRTKQLHFYLQHQKRWADSDTGAAASEQWKS